MHYLEVAKEAAQTAGGLLRAHFEKPLTVNATTRTTSSLRLMFWPRT
jgi:hypothetical protein